MRSESSSILIPEAEARDEEEKKESSETILGHLKLQIIEANLTRDTEMVGQMDPYLELMIGDVMVHRT